MFDPESLLSMPCREIRQTITKRDTILYALGVGAGLQAVHGDGLRYVYEEDLRALPTMAVTTAGPGFWQREPQLGIAWKNVVHAEQSAIFHQPLPAEGEFIAQFEISEIYDKGATKGALVYTKRVLFDGKTGDLLATLVQSSLLRGNGGFGGSAVNPRVSHAVPADRPPDHVVRLTTRPEQALIYRLSGDYNPLHVDPEAARYAGFDRPILQGLCSYAMAGRAVLMKLCDDEPPRLRRLDVRFSSPVYPGETMDFAIWISGPGTAALRAKVVDRDIVVLDNGYVEFD